MKNICLIEQSYQLGSPCWEPLCEISLEDFILLTRKGPVLRVASCITFLIDRAASTPSRMESKADSWLAIS